MQTTLEHLWKGGRQGNLSPFEQMRALVLREVYVELKVPLCGLQGRVAAKLQKIGGGAPNAEAVGALWKRVDADPGWFPGKSYQERHGPKPALTGIQQHNIARSMMAYKAGGGEPTYGAVLARCPKAVLNPATEKPVCTWTKYCNTCT